MQECKGVVICWQKSLKVIIRMETLVTVSLETKKCLGIPDIWDWYILQSVPNCQAFNSAQVIGFWPFGHPVLLLSEGKIIIILVKSFFDSLFKHVLNRMD